MSGHLRFGFAAFLVAAGFSAPAAANVITDFFSPAPAPEAASPAPAPAAAADDCLHQPGAASAGQHWVYRYDGHRKCWFQAAEDSAQAKKAARRHVARRRVADPDEDEPAPRKQKAVEDARAELVKPAPAETPEPAPSAPKLTIVRTIPVRVADAAAQVPPAPAVATPDAPQPAPAQPAPRQVDVEKLLAEAPAATDEVAAAAPAMPLVHPAAKTGGGDGWTASWLGALLMALGGAALLSSSRPLRQALSSVRFPGARTEPPVAAHSGRNEPAFGRRVSVAPASGEMRLSAATRRVGPRTARARRPLATRMASREAC